MRILRFCAFGASVAALVIGIDVPARAASVDPAPPLPAPSGTIVRVSTETQLQNAVQSAASNTTILISPGTYTLSSTLYLNGVNDVTLRGATNNRDDVVLVGKGMANSNFGNVEFGVWTNGQRNTIANLTIRDVWESPIQLNDGAGSPHIYNVHLINAGTQFIKSSAGSGVNNGIVEYSVIEYLTTARSDYTNGVDVHVGKNWIVRNNLFRNIAAPDGLLAGPAILFWDTSGGNIVDGNTFINCQREISMGLIDRTPNDHTGGIVRNNFIYRRSGLYADVAILVADSPGTQVLHNTVMMSGTYPNAIEYRFGGSSGVVIANNLLSGQIQARDGAAGGSVSSNYLAAAASLFVNAAAGDLHLVAGATAVIDRVGTLANAATDWDGDGRPQGGAADYGADEFRSGSTPAPTNQLPSVSLTAPANGSTFTSPASITLSATAADTDGTIAKVLFYAGTALVGTSTASPYSVVWPNVAAGTYALTAVAYDNLNATRQSAASTVTVTAPGGGGPGLPAPWATADLGSPAIAGSATLASGTFTVKGGGTDIWDTSDQFRFVYQSMTGDGQIVAKIASIGNSDVWAKAGVMMRQQLTGNSANAMALVSSGSGLSFQRRLSAGGASVSNSGISGSAPRWVKLVRAGSTFRGYRSTDGVTWTLMGTDTISMPSTIYVGLAVTSHTASASTTAAILNVAVSQ